MSDSGQQFFISLKENAFFINPKKVWTSDLGQYYESFGRIVASAITKNMVIGIYFADFFFKRIFNVKNDFEDLKDLMSDQEFENYKLLKTYTAEEIDCLYLDFTVMVKGKGVELIEGGEDKMLTVDNLDQYLSYLIEFYTYTQFKQQYDSFIKGFNNHIKTNILMEYFSYKEISIIICGKKHLDH